MPAKGKKFSRKKVNKLIDDITKLMDSNLVISKNIEKNLKKIQKIQKLKTKKHDTVVQEQLTDAEMENLWEVCEQAFKKENVQKKGLEEILEKLLKDLKL